MVEVTVLDSKHTQAVPSARTTTKDLYFAIHHAVGDFLDSVLFKDTLSFLNGQRVPS